MTHLVAAPDKFRGTASAPQAAAAMASAAREAGLSTDEIPLSDGGEGLLDAAGGLEQHAEVTGPLGHPVRARWQLVGPGPGPGPGLGPGPGPGDADRTGDRAGTSGSAAVIEMAEAAGRHLVPHPTAHDPVRASTTGVGQLVVAAVDAGATRVIVGCGGSATTDGGLGAVEAVEHAATARSTTPTALLAEVELVVACDVTTPFRDAARIFGPQKGATPEQVEVLTERLAVVATRYRDTYGVDVDAIVGAGAAGGLAGGLAALGGRLTPGFGLVADLVGLPRRLEHADLVVTGEGRLDPPSLEGKVIGGVLDALDALGRRVPVLCVVGQADAATAAEVRRRSAPGSAVTSLVDEVGPDRARKDTVRAIEEATQAWLASLGVAPNGGNGP